MFQENIFSSHHSPNTVNGRFGFVVKYQNQVIDTEFNKTWDEVDKYNKILSLSIWDTKNNKQLVELCGYEQYFFANEAVSTMDSSGVSLTAKLIGGFNSGYGADLVRIDLTQDPPVGIKTNYPVCPFTIHAMRPGLGKIGY